MLKDIFFSFKDTVKLKTTNPFFGTLIVVWIIHNWKFLYTIFNFESYISLEKRLISLESFLKPKTFLLDMLNVIWITFAVLIVTYALLNLSRLIVNLFEKRLTPYVYKISDYKSLVPKDVYDKLMLDRDAISRRLDTERENRLKLESDVSRLEEQLKKILTETNKIDNNDASNYEFEVDNDLNLNSFALDLQAKDYVDFFMNIIDIINKGNSIEVDKINSEKFNYLLRMNLIKFRKNSDYDDSKFFEITDIGYAVARKLFIQNKNKKE